MPNLAQCEKTETISELRGLPYLLSEFLPGWESPADKWLSPSRRRFRGFSKWSNSSELFVFGFVFNELETEGESPWKRISTLDHYPPGGNRASTRQGWFGPNFVTIWPTGVCVCSI